MGGFVGLARQQEVVDLLAGCVAINSVNADLKDGRGEAELGQFVAEYLAALGCQVSAAGGAAGPLERDRDAAGARRDEDAAARSAPGHDAAWSRCPMALQPRVADGRVYGRGACDTKGSLAAMMYAMKLMSEYRHALRCQPSLWPRWTRR